MFIRLLTPIFFAIFPVLAGTCAVYNDIMPSEVVLPLGLAVAAAVLVYLFFWVVTLDTTKSSIAATFIAGAFWFQSGIAFVAGKVDTLFHVQIDPSAIGCLYVLACLVIVVLIITRKQPLTSFLRPLYLSGLLITLLTSASLVLHEMEVPAAKANAFAPLAPPNAVSTAARPDVYYIVMDAFAAPCVWRELYKQGNQFRDFLRSKGFYVYDCARSNYDRTALSFCSFLNEDYLDNALPGIDKRSQDLSYLHRLTAQCRVVKRMRDYGYKVINVRSTYGPTYSLPGASNVGFTLGNRLLVSLLSTSVLEAFEARTHWIRSLILQDRQNVFDYATMVSRMTGPKFVVEHSLLSHPPFIINADGSKNDLSKDLLAENYTEEKYGSQLKYCEKRLMALVNYLLSQTRKPVIILQSDHGPALSVPHTSDRYIYERMHMLCAFYFPDQNYADMPSRMSAVNVFRCVENHLFAAREPYLENRSYICPDIYPYQFHDVTATLNRLENGSQPGAGGTDQKGAKP